jgi:hypothetical protein
MKAAFAGQRSEDDAAVARAFAVTVDRADRPVDVVAVVVRCQLVVMEFALELEQLFLAIVEVRLLRIDEVRRAVERERLGTADGIATQREHADAEFIAYPVGCGDIDACAAAQATNPGVRTHQHSTIRRLIGTNVMARASSSRCSSGAPRRYPQAS